VVKRIIRHILWASAACFALGLTWGFWSHGKKKLELSQRAPLRVLCAENWIPDSVLKEFSAKHNVSVMQWTYSNPNEFLRQMANSDGKIDVLCTSSLLVRSLVSSRWLKKMEYAKLKNAQYISVDFLHLPYDPESEYSVPVSWKLYGLFGKGEGQSASWKQTIQSKKVSLWGDELNVLNLLARNGIKIEERLQDSETKTLESEIKKFIESVANIYPPSGAAISAEAVTSKVDWIQIPLSHVSRLIGESSPYRFWLPTDGGTVDVGLLAVGERSERPEMAMELINHLISTEQALDLHKRLGTSVVHTSLNHLESIAPLQKAEALRRYPLTRYVFPDVKVDAIPRFQKLFGEKVSPSRSQ
jgi:spermidine/putrescine transport system substrate-binding protein